MKLRNKKTGEIGNLQPYGEDGRIWVWIGNMSKPEYRYKSLAELNEEWEDYEEPKKYWYITGEGDICRDDIRHSEWIEERKSIGNYFETEEEAEKATEKLKAWKRLKDKGFRFVCWNGDYTIDFMINGQNTESFKVDELSRNLCVVFRGEE